MENYLHVGNIPKFGQKGEKYGHMEQVHVAGPLGPTGHRSMGAPLEAMPSVD